MERKAEQQEVREMTEPIIAYFDRQDTINGFFTIQEGAKPIFKRLQARSGQNGYAKTSWERGKSPVPFGPLYLWLKPLNIGTRAGERGVGEFFPISNRLDNDQRIQSEDPNRYRLNIGLHAENRWPGSAGCIVLVDVEKAYNEVFPYLRELGKQHKYLDLRVL